MTFEYQIEPELEPIILGNFDEWHSPSHYIVAPRPLQDVTTADNRCFTERRKKTVRFDQHDGRQGSQDSHRDSGIDTSSTFTSSEDSTRGDAPKVLVLYQTMPTCTVVVSLYNVTNSSFAHLKL